jgi:hypothetical protein
MIKFLILGGLALLVSDVSIPCKMNASPKQLTVALPAPILKTAVCSEAGTATVVWEYPKQYVGWFRIFGGTASGRYSLTFPVGRSSYVVRGLHPGIYFFRVQFFLSGSSSSSPLSNEKRVTVR